MQDSGVHKRLTVQVPTLLKAGQWEERGVQKGHRSVGGGGDWGHAQHAQPLVPLERLLLLKQLFAPAKYAGWLTKMI